MSGQDGQEPGQEPLREAALPVPAGPPVPAPAPAPRRRHRPGRWWRWPLQAAILLVEGILLILIIGGSMLAWRAAQGPVDLSWMLPRLGRIAHAAVPDDRISVQHLAIAWRGFTRGPDQPVQVTGDGISVVDRARDRSVSLDHAALDLSAAWAVRGTFAPRVVTLDGLRVSARRAAPRNEAGPPERGRPARPWDVRATARDAIAVLRQPPQDDRHLAPVRFAGLAELRRITVTGASLVLEPAAAAAAAPATGADLSDKALQLGNFSLVAARGDSGGLSLQASGVLASRAGPLPAATADARPSLSLRGAVSPAGMVTLDATAILGDPAAMLAAIGARGDLPVPDMAVQAQAGLAAGPDARITDLRASVTGGAGHLRIDGAIIPVSALHVSLSGDESHLAVDSDSHIVFGAVSSAPPPTVTLTGGATWEAGAIIASLGLGIDHVASDDVPAYWPPGFADGARNWIKAQVRDGQLHDGTVSLGLKSNQDLSDIEVFSATGTVPAQGLTVTWLPPIPPLTQVNGAIVLQGPDAIAIRVDDARQGDLTLSKSGIVITGLSARDQIGTITVNLVGPVAEAVALVNHPRLHLLQGVPLPLKVTSGTVTTRVQLALPLDANVTTNQITMTTHAALQDLSLTGLLLGRDVTHGQLTIDATMEKLHLAGSAALAGIPVTLALDTSFTKGPPSGVVASLQASATADQSQLAAAGIPTGGILDGTADASVAVQAQRGGRTDINARLALPESHLRVNAIAWAGGEGSATATAHLALQGDRIIAFDPVNLQGPGIDVAIRPSFTDGRLSAIGIDRLRLGVTDLSGSVGLPAAKSDPYVIAVQGKALDLSGVFGKKASPSVKPANDALSTISSKDEFAPHPPWRATVSLDRVLFGRMAAGGARVIEGLRGQVVNNGTVVQSADVSVRVAPSGGLTHLSIVPNGPGSRRVTLTSADLGGLLKATNAYDVINGGALRIDASYDDRRPTHPLSGTVEMDKFTLGNAPTVAKVLQGMTLYGVVDLMHGSGLFFSKLVAPFTLESRKLTLADARAYSASLGLTAHGTVDLPQNAFNIQGTIVPAYFFNSLLGHIPLIGKLFSPEKGGGIFAADFQLVGPINNPAVHVNALSMVAPGFLRDLFNKKGAPTPSSLKQP
ncbi:MAG TPA: DUF3971 domain-containing protein [Acidisoma sp.]|uniref:YhdP family protein n=1 Tax=Acidisoma sp. TaxID=1872115 RepID=UPI002BD810D1|nr:DUF3971 domain-containing protein [Acidisoma sp.]HTI03623.1 DUF3971 domain-containing protein [Acidisoma sp.]